MYNRGVEEQVRQTRELPDQFLQKQYKLLLENGNLCFFGYFAQPMFNLPDKSPTASSTSVPGGNNTR